MRSSTRRNTSGHGPSSAGSPGDALLRLALILTVSVAGCDRAPDGRYLVTARTIDVSPRIRLCLAVDPGDPHGVWWWEPGADGCTSRSTGPTVFHGDQAAVSRSGPSEVTSVAFRLGLISRTPSFLDVRLAIEDGRMRSLDTGAVVALQRRDDLELPERPPGSGRH